jgi:uncharacterized protein YuzE
VKARHFPDADTLLVDFSDRKVAETRDLNEKVLVELDESGHVVSMTIEHAKQQTDVAEFSYRLAAVGQGHGRLRPGQFAAPGVRF